MTIKYLLLYANHHVSQTKNIVIELLHFLAISMTIRLRRTSIGCQEAFCRLNTLYQQFLCIFWQDVRIILNNSTQALKSCTSNTVSFCIQSLIHIFIYLWVQLTETLNHRILHERFGEADTSYRLFSACLFLIPIFQPIFKTNRGKASGCKYSRDNRSNTRPYCLNQRRPINCCHWFLPNKHLPIIDSVTPLCGIVNHPLRENPNLILESYALCGPCELHD
jgi:hypothetical protein